MNETEKRLLACKILRVLSSGTFEKWNTTGDLNRYLCGDLRPDGTEPTLEVILKQIELMFLS